MIGAVIGQKKYLADAAEEKTKYVQDNKFRAKRLLRVKNIKQA